jgi:thioredoxin-like negative regulator of GroEL
MSGSSTQARSAAELAPRLVFFDSPTSGRCRRVEGFLAQVLQHRRNHDSFKLVRVSVDERPDLAERFGIERLPTLCVVGRTLDQADPGATGARHLQRELSRWLQ